MMVATKEDRIDAMPTKELFIDMLVRDVPLIRAIIDLIDNSVDGAIRSGKSRFDDFWILIEMNKDHLIITDNCGGIDVDTAKNHAFRFGRPKETGPTPKSIGQFGVGMKRTIFKVGKCFYIDSMTKNSHFTIEVDVDEWKKNDDWKFDFEKVEENLENIQEDRVGTKIIIKNLHKNVAADFNLENFKKEFSQELERAHYLSLDKGLSISLNGTSLRSSPLLLLHSDKIKPAYYEHSYTNETPDPVKVQMYAGVSDRNLQEGGWYVFCNGRMILEANQGVVTGWGEGKLMPKYHPDFAFFRGYVFFESNNAGLLPWTTTKTGVDTDSPLYKHVRLEMIKLARPVIDFLRKMASKKNDEDEDDFLETTIGTATKSKFFEASVNGSFVSPEIPSFVRTKTTQKIQYSKSIKRIDIVKKTLKARSLKEIGEKTFDYYYTMECED